MPTARASTSLPSRSSLGGNSSKGMTETAPAIVLLGVPEGLEARPVYRQRTTADGERVAVKTRRGLLKFDRVTLRAADAGSGAELALDEREKRFILGAQRRAWRSIE